MNIVLNGEPHEIPESDYSVARLLRDMAIHEVRVAVVINGSIIPKSAYETTQFNFGDTVDLITMVGGG
jgi:thiamine biosynthesis protein ThiS